MQHFRFTPSSRHSADITKRRTEVERKLHHGQHMLAQAINASHQHLDKRIKRIEDLLKGTVTINQDDKS